MFWIALACAVLGIANGLAAMFYGWHGEPLLLFFSLNFLVLGGMVQIGVFG